MIDKKYCMSAYLMYRYVFHPEKSFAEQRCNITDLDFERTAIGNSDDLEKYLRNYMEEICKTGDAALALSGGIDSAILARFMPEGSKAYTFRCIVPGEKVTDETEQAAVWADICHLKHEIIDIYWEDIERVASILMQHKGGPIHSIETQIYIAACKAIQDGQNRLIFGDNADIIYGGMNGLLAKDWEYWEFVDRYSYIMPYRVLKTSEMVMEPFLEFEKDGHIDGYDFTNKYFRQEALGTYNNACETAGIEFVGPYSRTYLNVPIDYQRIRAGETKYIVRELFKKLYPYEKAPEKIPMPRPMNEWLKSWSGPQRDEFISHCTDHMTGDQKWMIWSLEKYLDMLEDG